MTYMGDYTLGDVIYIKWHTSDQDGASITRGIGSPGSPNDAGEIRVYKNDSLVQGGASPSVIDDILDFDGLTGVHHLTINTGDDDFYEAGAEYQVVVAGASIDGQAVNAVIAHFSIENRNA